MVLNIVSVVQSGGTAIIIASLRRAYVANELRSFDPEVLTIDHVRKFARRVRDYMRAYPWGARGLDVETVIKKYKTHRSMIDIDFKFVSG